MDDFANRLNILIKENKTKKKDLAEAIGMSPQQISGLSKGKGGTTKPVVRAIADFYRVREEWLEYGTGEMMADAPKHAPTKFFRELTPEEEGLLSALDHAPELKTLLADILRYNDETGRRIVLGRLEETRLVLQAQQNSPQ